MPTPRPETSVTMAVVLKPGRKISSTASASDREAACSALIIPLRTALSRIAGSGMPPPSSLTSTTTPPESWRAVRRTVPQAGLPARWRRSGASMPWSTALRSRWRMGSPRRSMIWRSSSISVPATTHSTSRPMELARSRTMRGAASNTMARGSMRMTRALPCSSSISSSWARTSSPSPWAKSRSRCDLAPWVARLARSMARMSVTFWRRRAWLDTTSPISLISSSSLAMDTRTVSGVFSRWAAAGAGGATGAGGSGAGCRGAAAGAAAGEGSPAAPTSSAHRAWSGGDGGLPSATSSTSRAMESTPRCSRRARSGE